MNFSSLQPQKGSAMEKDEWKEENSQACTKIPIIDIAFDSSILFNEFMWLFS